MMRIIFDKLAPALTLEEVQEGASKYMIVKALTRYRRVILVRSTSTEDNIQGFSDAFSRHGIPKQVHSNNGAPFNGKDSNFLQRCFRNLGIYHVTNRSAEDPEATGMVEAFMRQLKKIFHTAGVEHKDPTSGSTSI